MCSGATCSKESALGGLDWGISRSPFQPLGFCDSVLCQMYTEQPVIKNPAIHSSVKWAQQNHGPRILSVSCKMSKIKCQYLWRKKTKNKKPTSKEKDHASFQRGEIKEIKAHDPGDKSKSKPKVYVFLQHLNEAPFITLPKGSSYSSWPINTRCSSRAHDEKRDPLSPALIGKWIFC